MLVLITLSLIAIGPFAGGPVRFDGWAIVPTLVAPAFYVIVIFVLPLDMTMSRVFMSGASEARRAQLKRVMVTEAVLFVLMVIGWLPFVLQLLRIS